MNESSDTITGLPTIHWLKHPEFYAEKNIRPVKVEPMLTAVEHEKLSRLLWIAEQILENSDCSDGSNRLGEFLNPLRSAVMNLNFVLTGREVPGLCLVKTSDGWMKRRVSTKQQPQGD